MSSIADLAPEIQKRMSGFVQFLSRAGFGRVEVKNMGCLMNAMLKKHTVHVSVLSRSLDERITPKKTWERMNRNIRRAGLGERLLNAHIQKNRKKISAKRYCVIDLSDIQKPYAEKMEGLGRVRDGDKSKRDKPVIGNGYYWLNGVMVDGSGMLPVYSEIYGIDYEGRNHTSENSKILALTDTVHGVHPEAVYILDRGGDRSELLNSMLSSGKLFVIRGQDQRSLRLHQDSKKLTNIMAIAKRTKTNHTYKSLRNGEWFYVGIRRVYLRDTPLWLVVSRHCNGGLSWYLTNVEGSRRAIMNTVMEAYGLRWRVEEYHRHIKQDYGLEAIRLRKYHAIKNIGVLVMLAASFCARLPEQLVIKMLAVSNLLPRKRLRDIPSYPYYMIVAAVAKTLECAVKRRYKPLSIRKRNYFQLNLDLRGF